MLLVLTAFPWQSALFWIRLLLFEMRLPVHPHTPRFLLGYSSYRQLPPPLLLRHHLYGGLQAAARIGAADNGLLSRAAAAAAGRNGLVHPVHFVDSAAANRCTGMWRRHVRRAMERERGGNWGEGGVA